MELEPSKCRSAWPPRLVVSLHPRKPICRDPVRAFHSSTEGNSPRRSGKSVRISAATSPRSPCGRRMRATVTLGVSSVATLFEDFQRVALLQLHAGGAQKRANRFGRAALASDHLAQVFGMNAEFQHG